MSREMSNLTTAPLTADELARLSIPDKSVELVRGHLMVREPPGTRHGVIAGRLFHLMSGFVYGRSLGVTCAQDTGFKIRSDPDTVRAADVAFVRSDRARLIPATGYAELAPDLVAEILSPGDSAGEVLEKIGDWLQAGTKLVWVVDPRRIEGRVYRLDGTLTLLGPEGSFDGEDVLPGFACRLSEIVE